MLGKAHAISGVLAGLVVAQTTHAGVLDTVVVTVTCAGAALLPDIDHPRSTTSNSLGPFTRGLSWVLRKVGGGHRAGTHSLLGAGLLAGGAYAALQSAWIGSQVALALIITLVLASLVRLVRMPGIIDDLAPIPVAIALVWGFPGSLSAVPVALAVGMVTHMIGDMATRQQVQFFWPLKDGGICLNLFRAGGFTEKVIVVPLMLGAIFVLGFARVTGVDLTTLIR